MSSKSRCCFAAAILSLGAGAVLAACESPESGASLNQPGGAPSSPSGSEWLQVKELTVCEGGEQNDCQGFYGFTVRNDGTYLIGPADTGDTLQGKLSQEELATLRSDADAVASQPLNEDPACEEVLSIPGIEVRIDLTLPDSSVHRIYELRGARECILGDDESARNLLRDLNSIMKAYYPTPFPSVSASP